MYIYAYEYKNNQEEISKLKGIKGTLEELEGEERVKIM